MISSTNSSRDCTGTVPGLYRDCTGIVTPATRTRQAHEYPRRCTFARTPFSECFAIPGMNSNRHCPEQASALALHGQAALIFMTSQGRKLFRATMALASATVLAFAPGFACWRSDLHVSFPGRPPAHTALAKGTRRGVYRRAAD